jgi:FAD binding domain-containing protein/berberine-like enzyme
MAPQLETLHIEQLSPQFTGELLRQGDSGYDDARLVWNGMFDRSPALIARCKTTADVVAAVNFARENDLIIAVRGGGHSAVGYSTCDGGVVIDLAEMNKVEVDPETRLIRAGGGTTWGQFDAATQEHGLAVTGGRFSTTGIAGLTLGSGSGWLERKCGLTADSLVSAEVVTADGSVVRASRDENPELFWGLKGGGGNFGVVTEFEFRGHQVGPLIYGGLMACLPDRAPEILAFMRDYMEDAPEDLGVGIAFVSAPPEPFVPPEMHFKPITGIVVCWTGSQEEGEKVCAPIREVAQPVMDMVGPIPYAALQSMLDGGGPHGIRGYFKAEFLPDLSDDVIAKAVAHGNNRPSPTTQLLFEPMGGAMRNVDDDDSAVGRRDIPWCYHALAMWMEPGQEAEDAHRAWARGLHDDLEPDTTPGVYLNFTSDSDDQDRVRNTFGPEKYARLQALKDQYDPQNLFRLNQNIKPSAA